MDKEVYHCFDICGKVRGLFFQDSSSNLMNWTKSKPQISLANHCNLCIIKELVLGEVLR